MITKSTLQGNLLENQVFRCMQMYTDICICVCTISLITTGKCAQPARPTIPPTCTFETRGVSSCKSAGGLYSSPAKAAACTALETAASAIFEAALTTFSASASAVPSASTVGPIVNSTYEVPKRAMQSDCTENATSQVLLRRLMFDSLHKFWQLQKPHVTMRVPPQQHVSRDLHGKDSKDLQ